jgi:hypothetical protein
MLKLDYYGSNDGTTVPDVVLTGDPGTDQATLTAAGYLGGRLMEIEAVAVNQPQVAGSPVIVPYNGDQSLQPPYGALLNGPGEFAGAIGPSGSRKAPVVRALWRGSLSSESYDTTDAGFTMGQYVYGGGTVHSNVGMYAATNKGANSPAVGICTHVPSVAEPWLSVASLL